MEEIKNFYNICHSTPSDINEHLPKLLEYAYSSETITEMGVRWVTSTWAFLLSNPKKLVSYDVLKDNKVDEVINLSKKYNINYKFEIQDVLKIEIDPTDLLFIDTLHTYNQLSLELRRHSKKVNKFIILHDTETFAYIDESIYERASDLVKEQPQTKQGLWNAVLDFLDTDEGKKWKVLEKLTNNNGLTILSKI
jgi:hypothetical protein